MAGELLTGLSIFKTMLDMAKGLKDINDTTLHDAAVVELREHLFTAPTPAIGAGPANRRA